MQSLSTVTIFSNQLQTLNKSNQKFTDSQFPSDHRSFGSESEQIVLTETIKGKTIKFVRITDVMKSNPATSVVSGTIAPTHVQSSAFGNNYLVSAISALAEKTNFLARLFHTLDYNPAGFYGIWLCDNGEWRLITVDDYIPTIEENGKIVPAFSKLETGDLWISLLEKAYAKLHGGLTNAKEGFAEYALRELTGAPYVTLYSEKEAHKVWAFIQKGLDQNFLAIATYKNDSAPGSYAYSILDAKEVYNDKGKERLLLVRNPWNTFKWEGDWSNDSKMWTDDMKRQVGQKEPSAFWISIKDFVNTFEDTSILELRENNYYSSVKFDHSQNNQNYTVLRVRVKKATNITVTVVQKDERDFTSNPNANYTYSFGRMLVGKVTKDGLVYTSGVADQAREMQCGGVWDEGVYIVAIEMHWVQNVHRFFNVSFYTSENIDVEGVKQADLLTIQKNLLKSIILTAPPKDQNTDDYSQVDEPNAQRVSGLIHGMLYFYYTNTSSTSTKITENVEVKGKNLKICPPFTKNNSFYVSVVPGGEIIVLIKIMSINHSYQLSFNFLAQNSTDIDDNNEIVVSSNVKSAEYKYIDDPTNQYPVDINDAYNQHIRNKKINLAARKSTKLIERKAIKGKLPKEYPEIMMGPGEYQSKKVPYTNFTKKTQMVRVTSSDESLLFIKTPEIEVKPSASDDIRIRITAPEDEGVYEASLLIFHDQKTEATEMVIFTIRVFQEHASGFIEQEDIDI
jgi:calpain-15